MRFLVNGCLWLFSGYPKSQEAKKYFDLILILILKL
jgi:hypothetical protein